MINKLILQIHKSWDVTTILCMHLIKIIKKKSTYNIFLYIWYNNFEKTCGLWSCNNFQIFFEEVDALVRVPFEKQPIKKKWMFQEVAYLSFFFCKKLF
jgi:hypothetical protein